MFSFFTRFYYNQPFRFFCVVIYFNANFLFEKNAIKCHWSVDPINWFIISNISNFNTFVSGYSACGMWLEGRRSVGGRWQAPVARMWWTQGRLHRWRGIHFIVHGVIHSSLHGMHSSLHGRPIRPLISPH